MQLNGKTFLFAVGAIILALVVGSLLNVLIFEKRASIKAKKETAPAAEPAEATA